MRDSDAFDDQERLHLVRKLIEAHGPKAAHYARRNAERLFELDDWDGGASWDRIADAVDAFLDPKSSGTLH